jgi:hypothetical protein
MKYPEHTYYWAWLETDNPDHRYMDVKPPAWYRVFRYKDDGVKDVPVTEPMSKQEAVAFCRRIVKLTGGKELA